MLPEVSLMCIKEQKQILYKLYTTENVCVISFFYFNDGGIIYLVLLPVTNTTFHQPVQNGLLPVRSGPVLAALPSPARKRLQA